MIFLRQTSCRTASTSLLPSVSHGCRGLSTKSSSLIVTNPYNDQQITEVKLQSKSEFTNLLEPAREAQKEWGKTSLNDRLSVFEHFITYFKINKEEIGREISLQMGKPLSQAVGEISGLEDRTKAFIDLAPKVLSPEVIENSEPFSKVIHKEPKGVVMSLAPWNYPLLTAVNSVVPAILCGNSVLLSHGPKTPLTSVRFRNALEYANF